MENGLECVHKTSKAAFSTSEQDTETATGGVLYGKVFLEISQNSQENNCANLPMPNFNSCNVIKKETLAQVFSCELCEITKNTFFTEHLRWLLLEIKAHAS